MCSSEKNFKNKAKCIWVLNSMSHQLILQRQGISNRTYFRTEEYSGFFFIQEKSTFFSLSEMVFTNREKIQNELKNQINKQKQNKKDNKSVNM